VKPKLQIIGGDVYMADPPTDELLKIAFVELDTARRATAEAEAEVKRLVKAYATERGLRFMRVEAARREIMGQ
jgi:tricorn protease-like protein